jgi:hypothetical protein
MNKGSYSDVEDEHNITHEYIPEDEYGEETDFAYDALSVIGVISVYNYLSPDLNALNKLCLFTTTFFH